MKILNMLLFKHKISQIMFKSFSVFILFICLFFSACQESNPHQTSENESEEIKETNPPAEGFNLEASDLRAIEIADEVMKAMGGREHWDDARYLNWSFFGKRNHVWDKLTGNIRIEAPEDSMTYLMNINSMEGKVWKGIAPIENPDTLKKFLLSAKSMWINDSYWLVMPFKLKDSGVTLKYVGQDTTEVGQKADILSLTFENVGFTPENKYHVYVDLETRLINQWTFFTNKNDEAPRFSTPWSDYIAYGPILLSGNRGRGQLTEIAVYHELSEKVFTDLVY